uniref:Uncharacterized protein n=1 Tax=Quercus lobata TaxID=97700 RepID=A0A7N2N0D0_QUELO
MFFSSDVSLLTKCSLHDFSIYFMFKFCGKLMAHLGLEYIDVGFLKANRNYIASISTNVHKFSLCGSASFVNQQNISFILLSILSFSIHINLIPLTDGKLKISEDGLPQHNEKGIPISGDVRNCWAGFSLLQALFVKEHNVVRDMLKVYYPDLDDEQLYRHARLVTAVVIAKIHTID